MDHISYDFGEIDAAVRQELHSTATRLNTALDDLATRIAPLQQVWTRESAEAYRIQQSAWQQSAGALNDILVRLANAVAHGAGQVADTDRAAANAWR